MEFDNKVFCWITMVVALCIIAAILWPTRAPAAYTCADVDRAVALAGTSDPAALERAVRGAGITVTPALRRLARNCLGRGNQLARKNTYRR